MAEQGIWKTLTQIGAVAAVISAILGGWWKIESTIDTAVKSSTTVITKDLETSTIAIATEFMEDLKLRLHIVQMEIRSYQHDGKPVPERLQLSEQLLQDRIKDMEKKWFTPED
jgi:hypothetical protein